MITIRKMRKGSTLSRYGTYTTTFFTKNFKIVFSLDYNSRSEYAKRYGYVMVQVYSKDVRVGFIAAGTAPFSTIIYPNPNKLMPVITEAFDDVRERLNKRFLTSED